MSSCLVNAVHALHALHALLTLSFRATARDPSLAKGTKRESRNPENVSSAMPLREFYREKRRSPVFVMYSRNDGYGQSEH